MAGFRAIPAAGTAPLAVRFEIDGVRVPTAAKVKIDFGDGTTADTFRVPKLSDDLVEVRRYDRSNNEEAVDYRVTHVYSEPGRYESRAVLIELASTEPPDAAGSCLIGAATILVTN